MSEHMKLTGPALRRHLAEEHQVATSRQVPQGRRWVTVALTDERLWSTHNHLHTAENQEAAR